MKITFFSSAAICTILLASCRSVDWCATGALEASIAENKLQSLPYVFTYVEAEATVALVVSIEIPGSFPRQEGRILFRPKRPEEKVTERVHVVRLPPRYSIDEVSLSLEGDELTFSATANWSGPPRGHWGSAKVSYPIEYLQPFESREGGMVISGSWQKMKEPNKQPEPMSGLKPGHGSS